MSDSLSSQLPFYVKNCSLASIATGEHASSLLELRDKLITIDKGCLYFHFWGSRMNPKFVHPQYHNDFALWAHQYLHDTILAERLSIIDPTEFEDLDALRQELLETIERRLDEYEIIYWAKKNNQFYFINYIIIVFEGSLVIRSPLELPATLGLLPPSSFFYHFIDARSRTTEKLDDFSVWLKTFGNQYSSLIENIQSIDPYFFSLTEVKEEVIKVVNDHFKFQGK